MDVLGPFALLSLLYGVLALRVVWHLARSGREVFDHRFTPQDRTLVDQAAFFVLVPVAVALHEVGHAVAIKLYGGRILDWGYFGFAGFVGYDPRGFSPAEQVVVAAAGTIVNLVLAGGALALVFGRRPPLRAAINELLLQFAIVSLLNALVVYPLLDVVAGMSGDWTQMYGGGVPALSLLILVLHASILGALFWAWRNPGIQARVAALTGAAGFRAIPVRPGGRSRGGPSTPDESPAGALLREAGERVAGGWPQPVRAAIQPMTGGGLLILSWEQGGMQRTVLARIEGGALEVVGVAAVPGEHPLRRRLGQEPVLPNADGLTLTLRIAMETVAGWTPAAAGTG